MFYCDECLVFFIDGLNLYVVVKVFGFDIDYKLLRNEFMCCGKLFCVFYYIVLLDNDEYLLICLLVDWLNYNGFNMVIKLVKEYIDSMGCCKVKGNMDIELIVDVMEFVLYVDYIVFFLGDGDFCLFVVVF